MASEHYDGREMEKSGFSSWASSLHLVLCFAKSMKADNEPHVAVMDTHKLEDEVLVWHVPHLIDGGNHAYLAYGHIKGYACRAISLSDMQRNGLLTSFAELPESHHSGTAVRINMFSLAPWPIGDNECIVICGIATLFGDLSFTVAIALLSLRPRE
ncbi:hypothetical protein BKA63DRAFT_503393 [Paraphoma chrysanthemicola]|nr:hypothetical protein BKA63DRAFT_503393 [Paraphoma chrysanthemicola]